MKMGQKCEYLIYTAVEAWNDAGKIILLCIPLFIFLHNKVDDKKIWTK